MAKSKPRVVLCIQPIVHISIFTFQLDHLLIQRLDLLLEGRLQSISLALSSMEIRFQVTQLTLKLGGVGLSNCHFLFQVYDLLVQIKQLFPRAVGRFSLFLQVLVVNLNPPLMVREPILVARNQSSQLKGDHLNGTS